MNTTHTRPLRIGMSACFFHADPQRPIFKGKTLLYLEESMAHWLMQRRVIPCMIPRVPDDAGITVEDVLANVDGLVLQGGSDVSPVSYGETPLRPEWSGDRQRDLYEMHLLHACMGMNKPVLGVCRGLQLINVALGGTLYQDIGEQVPQALAHRDWHHYDLNKHAVQLVEGSRLAALYANTSARQINSVHHQAIKDLAPGLTVEARATSDRMIEAVRYTAAASTSPASSSSPSSAATQTPYVFGVQWHPEFLHSHDPAMLPASPILDDFLDAVRARVTETSRG